MFENYVYMIGDTIHYLESMYVGALDKDEWDEPLPFVVFYDKDTLRIREDGGIRELGIGVAPQIH